MCKFKVGDRVVRVGGFETHPKIGAVCVVSFTTPYGRIGLMGYDGRDTWDSNDFELAPDTSKRRPHYDLIIAWANGAEIQWFNTEIGEWQDMKTLSWAEHHQYRIKPNPKDEALEAAKKAFEQAEEAYKKAAEALAKAGG